MDKVYETRTFKNKSELAMVLLDCQLWRVQNVSGYCCFNEEVSMIAETKIPFRYKDKSKNIDTELDGFWECADGKTLWERIG